MKSGRSITTSLVIKKQTNVCATPWLCHGVVLTRARMPCVERRVSKTSSLPVISRGLAYQATGAIVLKAVILEGHNLSRKVIQTFRSFCPRYERYIIRKFRIICFSFRVLPQDICTLLTPGGPHICKLLYPTFSYLFLSCLPAPKPNLNT